MFGKNMRLFVVFVIVLCLIQPLHAKIGWTLAQCIAEYGPVVEKYGDDQESLPEYEFLKDDTDVTVIMIDEHVAQITISPRKALSDSQIFEVLQHYSGFDKWEERPNTEQETTEKISGFLSDHKKHRYFRTPGKELYGFVKYDWISDRPFFVKITIPEHKERLLRYREEKKK
jgi:hypothetical protein